MRGSVAKVLRTAARAKYLQLAGQGVIPKPKSLGEMRAQMRRLYKAGKKAYMSLPEDERARYCEHYRKSRIVRLDLKRSLRESGENAVVGSTKSSS